MRCRVHIVDAEVDVRRLFAGRPVRPPDHCLIGPADPVRIQTGPGRNAPSGWDLLIVPDAPVPGTAVVPCR